MEATLYNQKGKAAGSISLPAEIFGLSWNADLVHQVVIGMESNKRAGTADTKDRSEVAGGGKKPWKQKGTGRARHGSIRSPLWKGGGVTHGPLSDKNYSKKINKKMRAKALFTVLSKKFKLGHVLFVDTFAFDGIKTKNADAVLKSLAAVKGFERLGDARKKVALIALPAKDSVVEKSFNNLTAVALEDIHNMSVADVLRYRYLIITNPDQSLAFLGSKQVTKAK